MYNLNQIITVDSLKNITNATSKSNETNVSDPNSTSFNKSQSQILGPPCRTGISSSNITMKVFRDDAIGSNTGYPGGYLLITTDGCPGYDWTSQSTPYQPLTQWKVIKLPLQPKLMKTKFYIGIKKEDGSNVINPVFGPVGVAINGVSIYGNSDSQKNDAMIYDHMTHDICNGHIQKNGDYHYHGEPTKGCVFNDTKGQHSPLFGYMFDGIPIYGSQGDCGIAPKDLDDCGGHVDKTFPFYHYHLPHERKFPYLITCLRGCIFPNNNSIINSSEEVNITTCLKNLNSTNMIIR